MRVTRRDTDNRRYWVKRWESVAIDMPMTNESSYPLKYAEETIKGKDGPVLEAGCGAGRILRYYHARGFDIVGIDFVRGVVERLKEADPNLKAEVGDITRLRFADESFRYVLAFGLYHNMVQGLDRAVGETFRVMKPGGKLCASFRADNIQTKVTDFMSDRSAGRKGHSGRKEFHKLNLTKAEFVGLLEKGGFVVERAFGVENMPFLYKFRFFRSSGHKDFDESMAREEGYRLSPLGTAVQRALMKILPEQFCNIYVAIARKPAL